MVVLSSLLLPPEPTKSRQRARKHANGCEPYNPAVPPETKPLCIELIVYEPAAKRSLEDIRYATLDAEDRIKQHEKPLVRILISRALNQRSAHSRQKYSIACTEESPDESERREICHAARRAP